VPRLLLLAVLLVVLIYGIPKLITAFSELDATKRRRAARAALALVGVALLIVLLARFGLQWLGVLGAAVWAIVRTIVPWVLRLLPFSGRFRERWWNANSRPNDQGSANEGAASAGRAKGMSRAEALEVLGVEDGASREEILQAYRSLIRKVHPDAPGGSTYLATKLNQAKDVLLS